MGCYHSVGRSSQIKGLGNIPQPSTADLAVTENETATQEDANGPCGCEMSSEEIVSII